MTGKEILELIKAKNIEYVDAKLVDVLGVWQHMTMPTSNIDEDSFTKGFAFDGSSVRGYCGIEQSDMVARPDASTAVIDSFHAAPTLSVICDIFTPGETERFSRDPRYVAQKAEAYLKSSGIGDASYWGPEPEFFIFDEVRFFNGQNGCGYSVDSNEGIWNSNKEGSPGYPVKNKTGYFPTAPTDTQGDIRSEMSTELLKAGLKVERHHHEVATAGQAEINFGAETLTKSADNVQIYKYILRNVAARHGKTVSFLPKPLYGDNGTGMHTHQSIARKGTNLFWKEGAYANISDIAFAYIGGILTHAAALCGICCSTTNSYKRLVPGYEAPVNLVFSKGNRSAAVRIPISISTPKSARIEFRTPDATANPYLAFAAQLMAGLDGVKRGLDARKMGFGPVDKNIYTLSPREKVKIKSVPGSLDEALAALKKDHAFLLEGGVFTEDLLEAFIDLKSEELQTVKLRPSPIEFALYNEL